MTALDADAPSGLDPSVPPDRAAEDAVADYAFLLDTTGGFTVVATGATWSRLVRPDVPAIVLGIVLSTITGGASTVVAVARRRGAPRQVVVRRISPTGGRITTIRRRP